MRRALSLDHIDAQIKRWEKRCTRALNTLAKLRGQRSRLERKLKQEIVDNAFKKVAADPYVPPPPPAPEKAPPFVMVEYNPKPKRPGGAYWQRRKKMLTEPGHNPVA